MSGKAQELIASFDALPESDKRAVAVEILSRVPRAEGDVSLPAFDELADELFVALDAEETARAAADRGAVWIVDLGMAAKVRPC